MNHYKFPLAIMLLAATLSGCQNAGNGSLYGGPGLFGNVNGTRINPPPTGSIRYPQQVANLPTPYYTPSANANGSATSNGSTFNQGWRPPNPNQFNSPQDTTQLNPSANNRVASQFGANNFVVSSTTSALQPTGSGVPTVAKNVARQPPVRPTGPVPTTSGGALPLNDATRSVATLPNTGILNRTFQNATRPNTIHYGQLTASQSSRRNLQAAQPIYANGTLATVNPGQQGFAAPRPNSYTNGAGGYPYGSLANQNVQQNQSGIVAQGWRQRDDVAR